TADCLRCGTSIALDFLQPTGRRKGVVVDLSKLSFAAPTFEDPLDEIAIDLSVVAPPVLTPAEKMFRSLNRLLAMLASVIAHLVLLLLLAILTGRTGLGPMDDQIDLSMEFSELDREGGLRVIDEQVEQVGFELPLESKERARVEAQQWAERLTLETPSAAPNLPPI